MRVEIALSGRSKCLLCSRKIPKLFPRIEYQGSFICHNCVDRFLKEQGKTLEEMKKKWEEFIQEYAKEIIMYNLKYEN